jgi:predicted metal-binding membrane protein
MPSMDGSMTMSDPGVPEAMGTHNGVEGVVLYLVMWGVMMSAMMYPAMIPFVERYVANMWGSPTEKAEAVATFLGSYSLVWTATGVVPLAVDALVDIGAVASQHGLLLVGTAAVAAGAYQLTHVKQRSLRTCCSGVSTHRPSFEDAAERGVEHAVGCVRCTWMLFALMVVVGSMNLFWMLLLTAVVTLERFAERPKPLAETVGVVAVVGGVMLVTLGALGV